MSSLPCGLRTGSPPFPPLRLIRISCGFSRSPGAYGSRSPILALKACAELPASELSMPLCRLLGIKRVDAHNAQKLRIDVGVVLRQMTLDAFVMHDFG